MASWVGQFSRQDSETSQSQSVGQESHCEKAVKRQGEKVQWRDQNRDRVCICTTYIRWTSPVKPVISEWARSGILGQIPDPRELTVVQLLLMSYFLLLMSYFLPAIWMILLFRGDTEGSHSQVHQLCLFSFRLHPSSCQAAGAYVRRAPWEKKGQGRSQYCFIYCGSFWTSSWLLNRGQRGSQRDRIGTQNL